MLHPVRITPPAVAPVTLAEVKAHCRIDHDEDDALLAMYLDAALAHFDGWSGTLGRCLINQVWRQIDWRMCRHARLAFPDVSSVVLTYLDTSGTSHTVDAANYELIRDPISTVLLFKPDFTIPALAERSDAVRYTMTAGYGEAATDVPSTIRTAICMLAAHFYNNREAAGDTMTELPFAVSALCAPHRRIGV